jgi:hypothetical protein
MIRPMALIFLILMLGGFYASGPGVTPVYGQRQPHTFFKEHVKLADSEISKIEQGQIVTKVLESGDPKYGMLVFGAVYVNAPIEKFAQVVRDVQKLQGEKVYLAVQEFSRGGTPPKLSDFDRLELEKKDIDELGSCKAGDCDLQIINLEDTQKRINWNSPDKYLQVNKLVRERLYDGMTRYLAGGLKSLGSYRDRSKPLNLYQATKEMVDRSYYLPQDKAGGIYRHVIDYPEGKLAGAEDLFYWEKIDFGQEPTVRVNHVTLFPKGAGAVKFIVSNKQLFASRYMRVALQMFYCVPDTANPNKQGFFLIEMNDSRLPDFGSLKLAVVRKVATGKAVEGTHDTLEIYQRRSLGK